ncbi:MAG: serine/threonine-protein kinase [Planctomycetaceae bacterium]
MSSESASAVHSAFCDVAVRMQLLSAFDASRLLEESQRQEAAPAQVALRLGLLDAVAIDAIETVQRPTEVVPGYEILDVRGRGGMGVVYRARQTNLGRLVALKTVLVSRMSDANALARFEQEARTLAQLRHPNIVSIYDFGRAAGRLYLAMEFIDGTDVDGLVRQQGQLPEPVVWAVIRQVAAGLAHGDAQGIVHRDIKPANLLLVDPPEGFPLPAGVPLVKIADFGLALLVTDEDSRTRLTTDNATVGSPHYMAPEQLEGSTVDLRADMYALGASAYEMLAGKAPFAGLSMAQIIGAKLTGAPRPVESLRPNISAASRALVTRLMARDPAARPTTYSELLRDIDAALSQMIDTTGLPATVPAVAATAIVPRDVETKTSLLQTAGGHAHRCKRKATESRWPWIAGLSVIFTPDCCGPVIPRCRTCTAAPTQRPQMEHVGDSQFLFNGTSLSGWKIVGGQWSVPSGTPRDRRNFNGQLACSVPNSLLHPRAAGSVLSSAGGRAIARGRLGRHPLRASANPQPGGSAGAGPVYVIRLTPDAVTLGSESGARRFPGAGTAAGHEHWSGDQHEVMIERLPTGWFVSVDGSFIHAVPLHGRILAFQRPAPVGPGAPRGFLILN